MTNLSPTAQAVRLAAICAGPELKGRLAAALRVVVKKCVYSDDYGVDYITPEKLLVIADELEAQP